MSFDKRITERIPKKNDDESSPLKNCPFCGSNDIHMNEASAGLQTRARVWCQSCGCGTPAVTLNTTAVGLWNKRSE